MLTRLSDEDGIQILPSGLTSSQATANHDAEHHNRPRFDGAVRPFRASTFVFCI